MTYGLKPDDGRVRPFSMPPLTGRIFIDDTDWIIFYIRQWALRGSKSWKHERGTAAPMAQGRFLSPVPNSGPDADRSTSSSLAPTRPTVELMGSARRFIACSLSSFCTDPRRPSTLCKGCGFFVASLLRVTSRMDDSHVSSSLNSYGAPLLPALVEDVLVGIAGVRAKVLLCPRPHLSLRQLGRPRRLRQIPLP